MLGRRTQNSAVEEASRSGESDTNINQWERAGSGVLGVVLVASGLGRRTSTGAVLTLVGGWLLHRAIGGHGPLYWLLGVNTSPGRD